MTEKMETLGLILEAGLLPNLIHDRLPVMETVEAGRSAGIRAIEVSCRRPDVLTLLPELKSRFPDMRFGVSSLVEAGPYYDFLQKRGPGFPSIIEAAAAGADFLVSALDFNPDTYRRHSNLPIIPCVSSTMEAKRQLDYGANLIKFCGPAFYGGPSFFKSIVSSAPVHGGIPLLLTGGIRPEHIDAYVEAGMLVSVCGFDLVLQGKYEEMQDSFDPQTVERAVREYLDAYEKARKRHMPNVNFASADPLIIQETSGKFLNAQ